MLKREIKSKILFTALLVIMSSYPPLSTDMYLPSLSDLARGFYSTDSLANLTLVLFFIFFAISTLVWGPISDKFGRRPSLIIGIGIYTVASIGCALSLSIYQLIAFRVLQACGAGAPVTISIAIVQDRFEGDLKKKVLAVLSALMMISPVLAPVMGAFFHTYFTWRSVFVFLTAIGFISFLGSLFFPETNKHKSDKSVFRSFSGFFTVMNVPFFRKTVLIFSIPAVVALGFVGGSSPILRSGFGVSSNVFTLFFASNAVFAIIGSLLYVPVTRKYKINSVVYLSFFITAVSGIFIWLVGGLSPLSFMFFVYPATLCTSMIRPLGMDLLMEKSGDDAGSASAIINFLFTIIGSVSMEIISFEWSNRTSVYAVLTFFTGVIGLLRWRYLGKYRHG